MIRNRKATPSRQSQGIMFSGQTLLYENYKEPLKKIEKNKGYGFYGTVALTEDKEYVQCHVCGNLFPNVGGHVRKHKITAEEYKETYGLAATTALIGEPLREKLRAKSINNLPSRDGLPSWLQEYNKKVQSGQIKHPGTKRKEGGLSLQRRNELGLCPDQVLEKIRELADILGHTPSNDEFQAHYEGRYLKSIKFQHGSYLKAVAKLGMKSAKEIKEHTTEQLIQYMQEFHKKYGRIPTTSDINRGLVGATRNTYFHRFGTLNNARIEAGLNAIVSMGFGKVIELSPDEYIAYKAGRNLTSKAEQQRKRRAKKRRELAYAQH